MDGLIEKDHGNNEEHVFMNIFSSTLTIASLIPTITLTIYIGLLGLGIYCLILFIKLAKKLIRALDIYIKNND